VVKKTCGEVQDAILVKIYEISRLSDQSKINTYGSLENAGMVMNRLQRLSDLIGEICHE